MRISKFGWIGVVVVLGSCVTVASFAQAGAGQPPPGGRQGRGGFGPGGRFGGQLSLVNAPIDVLAKELKLTDEQKTAITAVRTKMQSDMQALMRPADGSQPNFGELQPKIQDLNKKATTDIETVLKDDQKAEAPALLKNLQSLQSLRIPMQTYTDLKLTADQKTKLAVLATDVAKDRAAKMAEMNAARQAGDQAKVQELAQAMRGNGQPDEKALAVLSADQKDIVAKYIKEHPQQGGRRPGGFGPGAAPPPQR